jgi:CRP-like cAMP-binding protein
VKYLPGDVITKVGQAGDGAYVILTGMAQRVASASATSATEDVAPGSLIGEMAMLIEHDYTATVIARDRVFCLKILRAALHAQMLADPTIAQHFHERVSEQLKHTAEELRRIDKDFASQPFPDRASARMQPVPSKFVAATYGRH